MPYPPGSDVGWSKIPAARGKRMSSPQVVICRPVYLKAKEEQDTLCSIMG
jgi:hypothetical protein